jgi:hypothetical protein
LDRPRQLDVMNEQRIGWAESPRCNGGQVRGP